MRRRCHHRRRSARCAVAPQGVVAKEPAVNKARPRCRVPAHPPRPAVPRRHALTCRAARLPRPRAADQDHHGLLCAVGGRRGAAHLPAGPFARGLVRCRKSACSRAGARRQGHHRARQGGAGAQGRRCDDGREAVHAGVCGVALAVRRGLALTRCEPRGRHRARHAPRARRGALLLQHGALARRQRPQRVQRAGARADGQRWRRRRDGRAARG